MRNSDFVKRVFDLVIAIFLLASLLPFLLLVALLVRIQMGSSFLFRQDRPGKDEKPFTIYKFRTMINKVDKEGNILPDKDRLTSLGVFLRKTSIDELPELFNVIRGDMSIVGPRPLLMQYLNRYTIKQARRHEVRPGITGWAQVNGRNVISWDNKFKLDVWYIDNRSLWLDMKIIFMTIVKTLKRDGISQHGQATMEEFLL
ncbi:MAG: sugar transferase [Candidatus Orphnella occulta]|nr:sugar transferase [Candidatus Orphnella occulta]